VLNKPQLFPNFKVTSESAIQGMAWPLLPISGPFLGLHSLPPASTPEQPTSNTCLAKGPFPRGVNAAINAPICPDQFVPKIVPSEKCEANNNNSRKSNDAWNGQRTGIGKGGVCWVGFIFQLMSTRFSPNLSAQKPIISEEDDSDEEKENFSANFTFRDSDQLKACVELLPPGYHIHSHSQTSDYNCNSLSPIADITFVNIALGDDCQLSLTRCHALHAPIVLNLCKVEQVDNYAKNYNNTFINWTPSFSPFL
jgi:hypothetical protein